MYIIEARVFDEEQPVHVECVEKLDTAKSIAVHATEDGFFYEEDDDTMTWYPADSISCVNIRKGRDGDVRD